MKTLLLVEDDRRLADALTMNLEAAGYMVAQVHDGESVVGEFGRGVFDLILLDIMLPGIDGLTICRRLRGTGITTPILFITARDDTDTRIEGLLSGGDDYITKPFNFRELQARLQAIFRRQAWLASRDSAGNICEFAGRSINFKSLEVIGPGGRQRLTAKECMVVKYLVEREGEVVSRDQLLDAIWGYKVYPSSRTIDNFLVRIRRILEDDPRRPVHFTTVRGLGYRFQKSSDT